MHTQLLTPTPPPPATAPNTPTPIPDPPVSKYPPPHLLDRTSDAFAELLAAYFHDTADLLTIARDAGITLKQLAAWRKSEVTQQAIAEITDLERQRALDLAARAAARCVQNLTTILDSKPGSEQSRKASTTLLRVATTPRHSETGRPRPAPPRSGGTAGGMVPAPRSHAEQPTPPSPTVPPSHACSEALLGADQPRPQDSEPGRPRPAPPRSGVTSGSPIPAQIPPSDLLEPMSAGSGQHPCSTSLGVESG